MKCLKNFLLALLSIVLLNLLSFILLTVVVKNSYYNWLADQELMLLFGVIILTFELPILIALFCMKSHWTLLSSHLCFYFFGQFIAFYGFLVIPETRKVYFNTKVYNWVDLIVLLSFTFTVCLLVYTCWRV